MRGPGVVGARAGVLGGGGAVRLLVVLVVTVALLVAAVPLAVTQAPRLHSPLLAVVAFGVAGIAFVAGVALLVRATMLRRRVDDGQPAPDEAVTEPRPGPEHIVLVPTAGRITVSAGASATGPRHALAEASDAAGVAPARVPLQARQRPVTAGQSPTGPSHTHAHAQAGASDDAVTPDLGEPRDPAVAEAAASRAAAFATRYTTTRSRR
jgi:hypothetical protein